jgi:Carbon storage regulator (could also regulate swarming and quorum sensing)
MLVMSHTTGDAIYVGDDVIVHVVQCSGGRVKLGFTAPNSVRILRDKVKRRMEEKKNVTVQDK